MQVTFAEKPQLKETVLKIQILKSKSHRIFYGTVLNLALSALLGGLYAYRNKPFSPIKGVKFQLEDCPVNIKFSGIPNKSFTLLDYYKK